MTLNYRILNDPNASIYQISLVSGARCDRFNEDRVILSATRQPRVYRFYWCTGRA